MLSSLNRFFYNGLYTQTDGESRESVPGARRREPIRNPYRPLKAARKPEPGIDRPKKNECAKI
jgi:hypothetical protein